MVSRAERARTLQVAQQAAARKKRRIRLAVGGTLLVVVAAGIAVMVGRGGSEAPDQVASSDGLLTTPPPWPAQAAGLSERIAAFGFPPVGDESYHAHVLLSVYRDGQQVQVPSDLGFDESGRHSSLHAHTPDGVIHMEADNPYPYELAQVMTAWGVAFDRNRLGGDVTNGAKKVHVYVNGKPAPAGPVILKDQDNVVIAYGTDGSFPLLPPADALPKA